MSIKKLFDSSNKTRNYLSKTDQKEAFESVESDRNLRALSTKQQEFIPQIDYSEPENFSRYGSAYLYYDSAIKQVHDYYPYDGSDAEITEYYNKLLDIEKYIFNNLYPRTNGLANFSADGWGSLSSTADGYGLPATLEYISFDGGPNKTSFTKLSEAFPTDKNSKFQFSNIYDDDLYTTAGLPSDYGVGTRESNLKSNFDNGVTVEFWLKKDAFSTSLTEKEVVLDIWNNNLSSSADYGRLTIELTGSSSGSPFLITAQAGTSGIYQQSIGASLTTASLGSYAHYAFVFYNSGTNLITKLYVNGVLNDENTTAGALSELNSKNMQGRIGALITSPSGSTASAGAGKLSGSLDEFRFWNATRSARDIARYWKSQVRGGANTDVSNTTLGLYYKFNEGIVGNTTTDSSVLDYSGRIGNGTWTGYGSNSRSTSSAMVLSTNATSEYLDPIIYSDHPDVVSLKTDLLNKGSFHDRNNNSMFVNMMPSWVIEEAEEDTSDLRMVSHIVGAYLDKLTLQIQSIPSLKFLQHTSASAKPVPFAQHLPQSLGLYMPEIFVDSTVMEKFLNRSDDQFMESDLNDAKNLIYLNLYNSLAGIYKAKGTEKAIRNAFRCFNFDDRVIKFKTYSDREIYDLESNLQINLEPNSQVNFNDNNNLAGVVYQKADPTNAESLDYISGSYSTDKEARYGFTLEVKTTFPAFERIDETVNRNYTDVSLFGMALANTASASDTTWASTDPVNFQVYAIRDKQWSKGVYFKLTSSISPNPFPELTSSFFLGTYDNDDWSFAVRLKPSNYPYADLVSGSSGYTYDLEFSGINSINGTIENTFTLTGSLSKTTGQDFLKSAKRIYAGARRTNITGALETRSDVLISNVKYWTKYLEDSDLQHHAFDLNNGGVSGSYKNLSALDSNLKQVDVKNANSLALHWTFSNITGSDSSGNFYYVTDNSSGSSEIRDNYGWIGAIGGYQHTGYGYGFATSSTDVVKNNLVNAMRLLEPETAISSNMIKVLSDSQNLFGVSEVRPKYFHTIEKSMYSAVSQEMLDFFAGVVDFHNVIGEPVQRYRGRYKKLEKLRENFFRKVSTVSNVEKFIEYYKWIDDALASVVAQLLPASSPVVEDAYNIIESHVLERNKYKTPLPIIKETVPEPKFPILGINKLLYNWKINHAPIGGSQEQNTLWWKERAQRDVNTIITSGDTTVNAQRETIRETIDIANDQSAPTLSTNGAVEYQGSVDVLRTRAKPYKLTMATRHVVKGGTNFNNNKDLGLTYAALYPAGPVNTDGGVFVPTNVLLAKAEDIGALPENSETGSAPSVKIKRNFKVQYGRQWEDGLGYYNLKSSRIFPFNVVKSDVTTGYNKQVVEKVTGNVEIVNLHNDVYGSDMERPMQGPFTDYAVGGHQSRHVKINQGSDDYTNRPEAWKLLLGTLNDPSCRSTADFTGAIGMVGADYPYPEANEVGETPYPMTASQKAVYYRDFTAKRPVNIRNINTTTGSTILGNYYENYEVVSSVGGYSNPRAFVDNPPILPVEITQTPSASQARSILDIRRTDESHTEFVPDYAVNYLHSNANNKSIIRSRFSSPGGIESIGQGYGDIRANEYSVYNAINYRNLTVRRPFQNISGTVSETVGAGTTGVRVSDINSQDFGLIKNLATHAGKFGRHPDLVTNPGASYTQAPTLNKMNRNTLRVIRQDSSGALISSSQFDNFFVQHQIPRADRQYAWITASLASQAHNGDIRYYGYAPTSGPQAGYYQYSSSNGLRYEAYFPFVSASDVLGASGTASLYQPTLDLNIYIAEPVDSASNNIMGYGAGTPSQNYYNTDLIDTIPGLLSDLNGNADFVNLTFSKRKYNFGYRRTPYTGPASHPVLRKHARENTLTIYDGASISRYSTKPFSSRNAPVYINMDANGSNITLKTTYNNENLYFSDKDLNQKVFAGKIQNKTLLFDQLLQLPQNNPNAYTLNWVMYSEALFPTRKLELTTASSTRVGYDNLYWRATQQQRIDLHTSSIQTNSYGVLVTQSAWVLDAPSDFLTRTLSGISSIPTDGIFDALISSNSAGELQNEYLHAHYTTASLNTQTKIRNRAISALYSRKHLLGAPGSVVSPSGIPIPETGSIVKGSVSAQFNNYDRFAGEAFWDAPANAGIIQKSGSTNEFVSYPSEPWFDDYDSYKEELSLVSKGYAVVPEFRLSEHISDYRKFGLGRTKDTFEVVGTGIDSSQTNFYNDYSNAEFMEGFANISNKTGLAPKEIRLACSASIRLMPYKGFYPAQRSADLVEQFKNSYGKSIQAFNNSANIANGTDGGVRPLIQPLFAPGILYNTIKSGMAVDYPIGSTLTKLSKNHFGTVSSTDDTAQWMLTTITGSGPTDYQGGSVWQKRIPFEAIIRPEKHIAGLTFLDMEPHPSASLDATASFTVNEIDDLYTRMASNYFGEMANFFLKDSQYTRLQSDVVSNDLRFESGSIYGARLKLRRSVSGSRIYTSESGAAGNNSAYSTYGARFYDSGANTFVNRRTYPLPQDPRQLSADEFQESFTLYSRPSAFGPPIAGRPDLGEASGSYITASHPIDSLNGFNWSYTPPYYNGEAWLDIVFEPNAGESYDLEKILSEAKTKYWRCDPGPSASSVPSGPNITNWTGTQLIGTLSGNIAFSGSSTTYGDLIYDGKNVNANAMQLSASIASFGVERIQKVRTDNFGNEVLSEDEYVGSRWVIQPKMETPMPNFNNKGVRPITDANSTFSVPTYASHSAPRGIWHQFGVVEPDETKGIFLEIGDIPSDWLRGHYDVIDNNSIYNKNDAAGNGNNMFQTMKPLTDVINFTEENVSVKLGQLAESKTIKEAIVAVPYQEESSGATKTFFEIDQARIEASLQSAIGSSEGDSLDYAGESIRRQVEAMQQYILPPQFDFLNNPDADPMVMYFFEFEYKFDKDDLNYIWQNLAPRNYKKITKTVSSTAHTLGDNELLTAGDINNSNTRWMVFKVKQRSQAKYADFIPSQAGSSTPSSQTNAVKNETQKNKDDLSKDTYKLEYNWPYDYVSFVETIKISADVLYKEDDQG